MIRPDPRGLRGNSAAEAHAERRRAHDRKSQLFQRVFKSEDGKKVMEELRNIFDRRECCTENPHETLVRAAKRDVFLYIDLLVNPPEKESYDGRNEELV